MEKDIDIHNYGRKLDSILKNIKESNMSQHNKELLVSFQNSCFSEGIGKAKIGRYLQDLKKIVTIVEKDLDICTKEDIKFIVAEIEKDDHYAESTKRGFRIVLKKYYKILKGDEETYPEEVRWIKTTQRKDRERLPEEFLSEEDILRLIQNAKEVRDKALIAVLYESGCRIGEIATLKIKAIHPDEYGAKIFVFGKTGSRPVRLVFSSRYLLEWINDHPDNNNPESYVWISQKKKDISLLSYGRLKDILRGAAKRAGIKKRVNPHSFRHARATYLAGRLSESHLKKIMGWSSASKMSSVYVHLSQQDTDEEVLKMNGIKIREEERSKIEGKTCIRCKHKSKPTSKFCELCGMILDEEESTKIIETDLKKEKINELMNKLYEDPEFKELISKKLKTD